MLMIFLLLIFRPAKKKIEANSTGTAHSRRHPLKSEFSKEKAGDDDDGKMALKGDSEPKEKAVHPKIKFSKLKKAKTQAPEEEESDPYIGKSPKEKVQRKNEKKKIIVEEEYDDDEEEDDNVEEEDSDYEDEESEDEDEEEEDIIYQPPNKKVKEMKKFAGKVKIESENGDSDSVEEDSIIQMSSVTDLIASFVKQEESVKCPVKRDNVEMENSNTTDTSSSRQKFDSYLKPPKVEAKPKPKETSAFQDVFLKTLYGNSEFFEDIAKEESKAKSQVSSSTSHIEQNKTSLTGEQPPAGKLSLPASLPDTPLTLPETPLSGPLYVNETAKISQSPKAESPQKSLPSVPLSSPNKSPKFISPHLLCGRNNPPFPIDNLNSSPPSSSIDSRVSELSSSVNAANNIPSLKQIPISNPTVSTMSVISRPPLITQKNVNNPSFTSTPQIIRMGNISSRPLQHQYTVSPNVTFATKSSNHVNSSNVIECNNMKTKPGYIVRMPGQQQPFVNNGGTPNRCMIQSQTRLPSSGIQLIDGKLVLNGVPIISKNLPVVQIGNGSVKKSGTVIVGSTSSPIGLNTSSQIQVQTSAQSNVISNAHPVTVSTSINAVSSLAPVCRVHPTTNGSLQQVTVINRTSQQSQAPVVKIMTQPKQVTVVSPNGGEGLISSMVSISSAPTSCVNIVKQATQQSNVVSSVQIPGSVNTSSFQPQIIKIQRSQSQCAQLENPPLVVPSRNAKTLLTQNCPVTTMNVISVMNSNVSSACGQDASVATKSNAVSLTTLLNDSPNMNISESVNQQQNVSIAKTLLQMANGSIPADHSGINLQSSLSSTDFSNGGFSTTTISSLSAADNLAAAPVLVPFSNSPLSMSLSNCSPLKLTPPELSSASNVSSYAANHRIVHPPHHLASDPLSSSPSLPLVNEFSDFVSPISSVSHTSEGVPELFPSIPTGERGHIEEGSSPTLGLLVANTRVGGQSMSSMPAPPMLSSHVQEHQYTAMDDHQKSDVKAKKPCKPKTKAKPTKMEPSNEMPKLSPQVRNLCQSTDADIFSSLILPLSTASQMSCNPPLSLPSSSSSLLLSSSLSIPSQYCHYYSSLYSSSHLLHSSPVNKFLNSNQMFITPTISMTSIAPRQLVPQPPMISSSRIVEFPTQVLKSKPARDHLTQKVLMSNKLFIKSKKPAKQMPQLKSNPPVLFQEGASTVVATSENSDHEPPVLNAIMTMGNIDSNSVSALAAPTISDHPGLLKEASLYAGTKVQQLFSVPCHCIIIVLFSLCLVCVLDTDFLFFIWLIPWTTTGNLP